jgi:hypothetical protein
MTPSAQTAGGRRVRRWTRELIIEKILEWEARYGEPPCSADWNPSLAKWRAQEWRAERYREGTWPSTNAAKRPFGGSFDAAVRAAGLEPRRPGPKRAAGEARPEVPARARDDDRNGARGDDRNGGRGDDPAWRDDSAHGDDTVAAALERARRAEARAAALERARRAEARVAALERGLLAAEGEALDRLEALIADAEARVRAADDQAEAAGRDAAEAHLATAKAQRDAAEARQAAAAAERRARELSALVADGQHRLTPGELAALRSDGPSGPAVLAGALRRLAKARASGDRGGLRVALGEVASAAVRWHDRL